MYRNISAHANGNSGEVEALIVIGSTGEICLFIRIFRFSTHATLHAPDSGLFSLTMLVFVSVLVAVHTLIQFGIGALLRQDWAIISMASQANLGGCASCLAITKSLKLPDLKLPGILASALGNAIGTYCGLLVAEHLRTASWLIGS